MAVRVKKTRRNMGSRGWSTRGHFDLAAPAAAFASFRQSERNFFRSLPWSPFSSACFEHSIDSALRGFSAFLGAAVVAGAAAGAVCAKAVLASRRQAKAAATAREESVIIRAPMKGENGANHRARMMNLR